MNNKEIWESYREWDLETLYDLEEKRIIEIITSTQTNVQELLREDPFLIEVRTAQRYLLTE